MSEAIRRFKEELEPRFDAALDGVVHLSACVEDNLCFSDEERAASRAKLRGILVDLGATQEQINAKLGENEQCSECKNWYMSPVGYHHSSEECARAQEKL